MNDHHCAAGRACRDPVVDPTAGVRTPAIIAEQRGLCRRCTYAVKAACRELSNDWNQLSQAVSEKLIRGQVHVSSTPEPPMPLNGSVMALRSTLSEWSEAALWMVAETLKIDVKERHKAKGYPVREAAVVMQAARVLPENVKILLVAPEQPVTVWVSGTPRVLDMDGIDVALKLVNIHGQITGVLGESNPRKRLSMPCPNIDCGAPTLGINNGETDVTCTECGGRWSEREYDWLANLLVSEHKREESELLRYLLAEAQWWCNVLSWCVAERDWQMSQIHRLTRMQPHDLDGIDAWAVVELLCEIVGSEKPAVPA